MLFGLLLTLVHPGNTASIPSVTGWHETPIQIVSTESTAYSYSPNVAPDSKGNIHVVWTDDTDMVNGVSSGSDADIFYKMYNDTTQTWTTTQVVSTDSTGNSYLAVIVVDSQNNVHVVWQDYTDYNSAGTDSDIFYKMLNQTTHNWSVTKVISSESTDNSYYPMIVVDHQNNIHVVWEDKTDYNTAGTDNDIFYKMYDANTQSWTTTEVISTQSTASSYNPALAADSQNNIHVVWQDYTDYNGAGTDADIFYKIYNATISSWGTTEVVSTESTSFANDPSIDVDPQNNVHVAWEDTTDYLTAGTDNDIFYKMYNTTTQAWTTTQVVSTESTLDALYSSVGVDQQNNVHVVWQDQTDVINGISYGNDNDIFYRMYNTTSQTWTITKGLSPNSAGDSTDPNIAVDNYGNLHIVWRDDPTNSGSNSDIFFQEFVNLGSLPITSTVTQTEGQTVTTTQNNTQITTTTQTTTQNQVETTTVVSTVLGNNQNTTTSSTPWIILPTIMAFVAIEIMVYRRRNY